MICIGFSDSRIASGITVRYDTIEFDEGAISECSNCGDQNCAIWKQKQAFKHIYVMFWERFPIERSESLSVLQESKARIEEKTKEIMEIIDSHKLELSTR
jgi:hypothetical protein